MTSVQDVSHCGEKSGLDVDLILEALGRRGRYQTIQLMLCIFASFLYAIPLMEIVFIGYQPDYQCNEVDNVTQMEDHLPDDVTNFTLHDVQYHQCSIDVTVNTSSASSTHSLPCVDGVNFSMPSHTSFLTEWSLVCDKASQSQLTQTGHFGGQLVGNLLFSTLADRYGRKNLYISCSLCSMVALYITTFVPNYYLFLAGKISQGFFIAGMILPAYSTFIELVPQQWRSLASVIDSIMWSLGCFFLAATGYLMQGVSWRYLRLVIATPFVYSLILPWFLDESLRWLLATGRIKEAEKILKKACKMNGKDFRDIQTMLPQQIFTSGNPNQENDNEKDATTKTEFTDEKKKMVMEAETLDEVAMNTETMAYDVCVAGNTAGPSHRDVQDPGVAMGHHRGSLSGSLTSPTEPLYAKYKLLDLCRHRVIFVPFLVSVFVWMTCNLYFYAVMLGSAKLSGNRFLNFALLNLQDIPSVLLALFLMRRLNRRPLSFVYGMLAGSFLLLSVALVSFGGGGGLTLTLATVAEYAGMFCLTGSYILLFVYYAEVYPTSMRAVGTGMAAMMIQITNMGAPFLLVWGEETPWAPGVLVGCLCCLASLSIWLLPETRHRKLPNTIVEMQAWKKKGNAVQPALSIAEDRAE